MPPNIVIYWGMRCENCWEFLKPLCLTIYS
nr:MAG TPA: glutaredoxin-like protein [Caudoviricetes sp.]